MVLKKRCLPRTSDEKYFEKGSEKPLATAYKPREQKSKRERRGWGGEGRKKKRTRGKFRLGNKNFCFSFYSKTTRRNECAPNLGVVQDHFINI